MPFNVAGAVNRLSLGATYQVTRFAPGAYNQPGAAEDGRFRPGAQTTVTIGAIIYSASPRELQHLPEGERTISRLVCYSTALLRTLGPNGEPADLLTYIDGFQYAVESVIVKDSAYGYYKSILKKVGNVL
jgi:hypothetical protein